MNRFCSTIKVSEAHIDARNHVNNIVYLQWYLDAAEAHWEQKTTTKLRDNYVWYVLNHSITYKAAAFKDDQVRVETWVSTSKGVRSQRHYLITRPSDKKTLVEAQTTWCLLNAETLKPTKITDEIIALFN